MEQPIPWVQQLAEGRLEQLDELFLTLSTVLRRAVYEAIGICRDHGFTAAPLGRIVEGDGTVTIAGID